MACIDVSLQVDVAWGGASPSATREAILTAQYSLFSSMLAARNNGRSINQGVTRVETKRFERKIGGGEAYA